MHFIVEYVLRLIYKLTRSFTLRGEKTIAAWQVNLIVFYCVKLKSFPLFVLQAGFCSYQCVLLTSWRLRMQRRKDRPLRCAISADVDFMILFCLFVLRGCIETNLVYKYENHLKLSYSNSLMWHDLSLLFTSKWIYFTSTILSVLSFSKDPRVFFFLFHSAKREFPRLFGHLSTSNRPKSDSNIRI